MKRDDNPKDQVESIIAAQVDRAKRLEYADKIIDNEQSPRELAEKVAELHRNYLKL